MKKPVLVALILTIGLCSFAFADSYTENFNAPFPTWEGGWLGQNSNLTNVYCGRPCSNRGNNPDGLWIGETVINFNPSFGNQVNSVSVDIATYIYGLTVQVMDSQGNLSPAVSIAPTFGAWTNPGVYINYSINGINGLSELIFNGGGVVGNTSIDNVDIETGSATPEPGSLLLLGSGLTGLAGTLRRKFRA